MGDEISVVSVFENGKVRPAKFLWHSKEYLVDKINMIFQRRRGASVVLVFSIQSSGETYKLEFNNSELTWRLDPETSSG